MRRTFCVRRYPRQLTEVEQHQCQDRYTVKEAFHHNGCRDPEIGIIGCLSRIDRNLTARAG